MQRGSYRLALMVMTPLLCVYADLVGMGAGLLIGTGLLDMSLVQYVNETQKAVRSDISECSKGVEPKGDSSEPARGGATEPNFLFAETLRSL